jgi:hypothetical protein
MLLGVKKAYPYLQPDSLILEDDYADTEGIQGLTVTDWNFKARHRNL